MQNENLKKLKDFFFRYKKNFGAAALLIVLIVVLVKCAGPSQEQTDTQSATEGVKETTETGLVADLQKDADPELVTLMQDYYTAYATGDIESLEMLAQPLSENEKSYISTFADYYEEYQNITCYSTQGATEDSFLVSVCYDLKFKDIDTAAPGMDFFYVERDGKGKLYVNNVYSAYNFNFLEEELDANLYALILDYEKSADVVALQQEVQSRYDEAVKSDENLANMVGGTLRNAMVKWRDSITSDAEDTSEQETEEQTQAEDTQTEENSEEESNSDTEVSDEDTGTVKTTDICNVRKEPSIDGEVLGKVDVGVKLKKLGTEGEWTKVEFQGGVGYIKSDLLKTVKKTN